MRPLDYDDVLMLASGWCSERLGSDRVALIAELDRSILSNRVVEVVDLVDGRRTVGEIVSALRLALPEHEVLYTLTHLVARHYLATAIAEHPREALAFWHNVALDAPAALTSLSDTNVSVRAIGDPSFAEYVPSALEQAGLQINAAAPVQVVVTDDYLRPELDAINRAALRDGTPWFLLKPIGTRPFAGPFFRPGAGPCWTCLSFWMRNNRPVEEMIRRHRGGDDPVSPPTAAIEASVRAACGWGAVAVARGIAAMSAGSPHPLESHVLALDWASFETSKHAVVKRPQCPACGDPRLVAAIGERPIGLEPVEKAHFEDGGYRRQTPRKTYARYQHLVSPITGPVTYLVPVPDRDTELRAVYASGYLVCPRHEIPRTNTFDKGCAGKGRSADQAKVSALCEALERYSGVYQGDEARTRRTKNELGAAALDIGDLMNFSDSQYRASEAAAAGTKLDGVDARDVAPKRFDPDAVVDWAFGWSLTHKERRYAPFVHCYAETPAESGIVFGRANGNGVAAGTCLEEALLQGFFELVERDAAAIWWYNRIQRPAVDLASFHDPYFDELQADYARQGWTIWVLDLTHDLRIPTCVALAHHTKTDRFTIGFGCHLEPRLAVQRSLTELNQLFEPAGSRRAPWDADKLVDRDYLFPHPRLPHVVADAFPRSTGADLRADIEECIQRLDRAGLELIAVDKTRPDIDLCVIQTIVPGLRHFWPRFGPGRLYDVPCALGWIPRPLDESELNPVPLFV